MEPVAFGRQALRAPVATQFIERKGPKAPSTGISSNQSGERELVSDALAQPPAAHITWALEELSRSHRKVLVMGLAVLFASFAAVAYVAWFLVRPPSSSLAPRLFAAVPAATERRSQPPGSGSNVGVQSSVVPDSTNAAVEVQGKQGAAASPTAAHAPVNVSSAPGNRHAKVQNVRKRAETVTQHYGI